MFQAEAVEYCGSDNGARTLFDMLGEAPYQEYDIIGSMIIGTNKLYIHGKTVDHIADELVRLIRDRSNSNTINTVYGFKYDDGFIIVSKDGYIHKTIEECLVDYHDKHLEDKHTNKSLVDYHEN